MFRIQENSLITAYHTDGYFPIVYLPKELDEIQDDYVPLPVDLIPPKKPKLHQPQWQTFHKMLVAFGFFLMVLGVFIIQNHFGLFLLCAIVGGFLVLAGFSPVSQSKQAKERQKQYNKVYRKYMKDVQLYRKDFLTDPNNIKFKKNVQRAIRGILQEATPPDIFLPNSIKGKEEKRFLTYLQKFYPKEVIIDHVIKKFGRNKQKAYQPDFIFHDLETDIYIDIEIDEPYAARGRKPIHYRTENGTVDDRRNAFFQEHLWIVVRFAEEQVQKYPNQCCFYIAQVIADLTGNETYIKRFKIYDGLKLPKVKHWTRREAAAMALINQRRTYVR